jgi:glycosyltransferase involved in cell wall biosynthesis
MACSRTIICFSGTGAAEVAGESGYTVKLGDINAAANVVLAVINKPTNELVNHLARERYERLFSPEAYARRVSKIIREKFATHQMHIL